MNLINGECLEELKKIENKSVDCFICDLPYGTTDCKWDNKIDLNELWNELKRTARNDNTPFFFFCDMKLAVDLINSNRKWFRYDLVIQKSNKVGFLNGRKMPMRNHELLIVFYKKLPIYNIDDYHTKTAKPPQKNRVNWSIYDSVAISTKQIVYINDPPLPSSILKMDNKRDKKYHKTQKSQDILEWIIKYYTNEGDTILDPTMGSGSTGVACKTLNRNFIGIEMNNEYFDVANERINNLNE